MKSNPIQDILSTIGLSFPGNNLLRKYADELPPLRSELFSADQMEQYGKTLATKHKLVEGRAPNRLLRRLAENEEVLLEVHQLLTEAVKANRRIIPAGEWLLDNFYLIQDQIRTGKKHLPKGYNEDLPRLLSGPSAELPRVYDIAIEIISHSDGRVDVKSLISFLNAYQAVTPLKLGELWAIPIMLRLALIENLRRLTAQIAIDRITQNLADYWAEQMTETAEKDPKSLILVIADMARSAPPMVSSFVAELTRQLQGRGPALALPLTWIEQRLLETGQTSSELVNAEIQKQAADQVSMSNSIGSLRFLGTTDWREFVETTSIVEQTMRNDIGGIYANMDFATRDSYRHVVERVAKNSLSTEQEVASLAIKLARESAEQHGPDDRRSHIGYYLVGNGLAKTEKTVRVHFSTIEWLERITRRFSLPFYLSAILFVTLIVSGGMFAKAYTDGVQSWLLITIGVLSFLSASQLAVTLVNWVMTLLIRPRLLPRMDFSTGIPAEFRTLVVVPTILTNEDEIERLTEMIEVHFLANRDEHLHFGLLTDFKDAAAETAPEDAALLQHAERNIKELNEKYDSADHDLFYLFHRPRKFNPHDKIWMGYERKRGKLTELNALLRGKGGNFFSMVIGDQSVFSNIRYVITIDSDTQLPRDSAGKIVSTMAHPLNHAYYNEKKKRVTDGYGILQPRVNMSLPGQNNSLYAHMHGSDAGIDPYTRTTSDVYQDLFDEGSFIGKGIYDVDIFSRALDGRFPENRILSHDLLEGGYTRSGLLSDEQFYEEYPSSYHADVKRRHRWIRGDWQIATWMLPWVPGADKKLRKNPLSGLMRWKIFDNIRRSLIPSAFVTLLSLSWITLPSAWFWTSAVLGMLLVPFAIISAWNILHLPKEISLRQHFKDSIQSVINNFFQILYAITCLPYEAYYTLDAIVRTNWRMIISHKHLLEWNPSMNSRKKVSKTLFSTYLTMWAGPLVGWGILIYLLIYSPLSQILASPVLILWIISPAVAWLVSRPSKKQESGLSGEQYLYLRKIARKTWSFFENFVGKEDNWLPPDNYQEHPVERIAHRTSPTNIGLSLLANLTAVDFGFIPIGKFIERTEKTFITMLQMERHRGHFYNWYDTVTLNTLPPRYVSTVDSGNLAGHLLTLRQGIYGLIYQPLAGSALFGGLRDTLAILEEKVKEKKIISAYSKELDSSLAKTGWNIGSLKSSLLVLVDAANEICAVLINDPDNDAGIWAEILLDQTRTQLDELNELFPWLAADEDFGNISVLNNKIPSLHQLANLVTEEGWTGKQKEQMNVTRALAKKSMETLERLGKESAEFADMEYDFLYDPSQHLLSIGYNVEEHRRDASFYDLLASEARLGVFTGIAQGKIPQESWFALGRQLTNAGGNIVLLSWSGSMFEYLMPLLVMPTHDNTLLDQTNHSTVQRQIDYGKQCDIPWGISESGYNLVDASLNYQYRAFGVPGLGLKRGLAEDLVIAPYATMMGLMVKPEESCENLQELSKMGFESANYGFFEAIDFTPARLPRGQSNVIVRSYMAHHQGMGFLSLAYALLDKPMQKRFESEPRFQATLLLLQERIPKTTGFYTPPDDVAQISVATNNVEMRVINTADTPVPEVQLLSNGRYHLMVTNAGGGYSRWKDIAVTRWREDSTCDNWGNFCYIRDLEKGNFWSAGHQPTLKQAKSFEAVFSQGRAEFRRREHGIETHSEIVVSPEDDIEIRRVHLTNRSRKPRSFEVTSYAEVVLTIPIADTLHPAFSNLFVQTEILPQRHAILCTRRPRSNDEHLPWMFHLMKVQAKNIENISFETDRMQFVGRGRTVADPIAMSRSKLSGTQGSVLDPVVAIRYQITLDPLESATVDMVYGMGETREISEGLIEKYQDSHFADRAFELAWTHSQVILRQINATEGDAQLYAKLAASVIYANASLRADPATLIKNHRGQSGLWSYSISGDLPIVLLQIEDPSNIELVKQLVQAHAYWRLKGLVVDLVIWNEDHGGYRQLLQNQLLGLISTAVDMDVSEKPGGIFVRVADQISNEDRILIQTVARITISDSKGELGYQISKRVITKSLLPALLPKQTYAPVNVDLPKRAELLFFNGIGGFTPDGKEYVLTIDSKQPTPLPWINVLANPNFGSIISESGQSYTWSENAHEFRLTPWNNDPVSDTAGEVFYIRDEENGLFWSPCLLPSPGKSNYRTRHGFGYSIFEHQEDELFSEMSVYTDIESPVKFTVLKIRNNSARNRKLSVTGYIEWVLGDLKSKSGMHIVTEINPDTNALFARNPYNKEFDNRVGFFDVNDATRTFTADRTEFIGRNRSLANPDAMTRQRLSGRKGAAMDPCGAMQVLFDLSPGEEHEIIFLLGTGINTYDAIKLVREFRAPGAAKTAFEKLHSFWQQTLGAVQVETPDPGLNMLTNGWLMYQTLACRFWARSGFYQSGGAFGFRDQLQDVMSMVHTRPDFVRAHILLSASRQFKEGDVQHWWHPPLGRGVRTKCSDDFLWLPLATCRYVLTTGDTGVLDETITYLEGRFLTLEEESYYDLPGRSDIIASLYDHCVAAIKHGLRFGEHGLPLMGSGDWNDGMDKVGIHGKGESVWLGFFLYQVLTQFIEIARLHGDDSFAEFCTQESIKLNDNIQQHAWDGDWYRRAYFDDGTPLGSAPNEECRIDSIAQSWSVLSGASDPKRSKTAMDSAYKYLVRKDKSIIQLLDPPFDKSALNPGYIKGYVPGVRENGGQYTHAAIWLVMAFAAAGNHERAWELFRMINPINHGSTPEETAIYKAEPYVVAADVYSIALHSGRSGWTWYTGSAGWMYRLMVESLLGIHKKVNKLEINPCIPGDWKSFVIHYRFRTSQYHITIRQIAEQAETEVRLDGVDTNSSSISLVDDNREHVVEVRVGSGIKKVPAGEKIVQPA